MKRANLKRQRLENEIGDLWTRVEVLFDLIEIKAFGDAKLTELARQRGFVTIISSSNHLSNSARLGHSAGSAGHPLSARRLDFSGKA